MAGGTMSVIGRFKDSLRHKKKSDAFPLLVFKEFEDSINLIEDSDHIARNFLGKIHEVVPLPKLILLVHDPDIGRFVYSASANTDEAEARAVAFPRN